MLCTETPRKTTCRQEKTKMYNTPTPSVAFSTALCHEHHSKSRHERVKQISKVNIISYKTCMFFILLCCSLSVVIVKSDSDDLEYGDRTRSSNERNSFTTKGKSNHCTMNKKII